MRYVAVCVAYLLLAGCQSMGGVDLSTSKNPGSESNPSTDILITIKEASRHQVSMIRGFSNHYTPLGYPASPGVSHTMRAISKDYGLKDLGGWKIKSLDIYCARMRLPDHVDSELLIQQLASDKRIESVQPVVTYQALSGTLPTPDTGVHMQKYNDPYFQLQFKQRAKQVESLHEWSTGKGIKIAVIDTGVDFTHPDIRRKIIGSRNFVDNDDALFVSDIHGTAVSGTIAAEANNGQGIVGIAPDAALWALKACWQSDRLSTHAECDSFTLANALSFAIDEGADIINLSLSGPYDPLIARLIETAQRDGLSVVAADPGPTGPGFPARLPQVIAVTSLKHRNHKSGDSAPLSKTINLYSSNIITTVPAGGYDFLSGSSMSAGMVSGYLALLLEKSRAASLSRQIEFLTQTIPSGRE